MRFLNPKSGIWQIPCSAGFRPDRTGPCCAVNGERCLGMVSGFDILKVAGVVRRPAPAREAFPRPETPSRPPPPSNDATTNASFDARDLWRPPIHKVPADSTNSSLSMSCKTVHSTMRTAGRPHVVRMLTFAVCVADLATRGPTHRVGHFGSRRRRESAKMGNSSTRRPSRGAISR